MQLNINISQGSQWTQELAKELKLDLKDNAFVLPEELGQGMVRETHVAEGIYITTKDVLLKKPWQIIKKVKNKEEFYPIIFHYSESGISQEVNGETRQLGRDTPNGVIFPSIHIDTKIYFPAHVKIAVLAIVIHKEWLDTYTREEAQYRQKMRYLRELFLQERPFFIYETMTPQMAQITETILQDQFSPALSRIYLQAKVLELLALFFDQLLKREFSAQPENLNTQDVEKLFEVQKLLLDSVEDPPTIHAISREIGMSESKLKKTFKQVFGHSIYQYILLNRMQKAKHLLDTRQYNVTEVGSRLGYSNLAHFARAFKKQFHVSPSDYLASLR